MDIEQIKAQAKQGNTEAQCDLGSIYYYGRGVPQDYTEAANWWRLAAEQGNAVAQYNLGQLYYFGTGVPQDDTEAAKWYRLAADQGHEAAQNSLDLLSRGASN